MKARKYLRGPFHQKIEEFTEFRKSLGFTMRNTDYVYNEFDDFLARHYPKAKTITRPMVIEYFGTTKHLHSTSRRYRVTLLRGLCRYLYQQDPRHYVPEKQLLPGGRRKLTPYIFSEDEIARIIEHVRLGPKKKIWSFTNSTIVALISVTGLRVSEVCRLDISDVDLKIGILRIQRSKFYKSRIVPISRSTVRALTYYKQTRLGYFRTTDPASPFFVGMVGRRTTKDGIGRAFRRSIRALNIRGVRESWPRLHDLRHTFATRSLEKVVKNGSDPEAYLPALATYMGHANLDYTQTYLHPSTQLLQSAGDRFNSYSKSAHIGGKP